MITIRRLSVFGIICTLISGIFLVAGVSSAHADCPKNDWNTIYPNDCILDYPDQSQITVIGSQKIKSLDKIVSCDDTFAGITLSTGYDYISYIRVTGVGVSGELRAGQTYGLEIRFVEDCRSWSQSYLIEGEIQFSNGQVLPVTVKETSFKYREKFTGSLDSYCFSNTCGTATFNSNITIPTSANAGSAKLVLRTRYNQSSASIKLTDVSRTWTYSNFLTVVQSASPATSNSPLASPSPFTPINNVSEIPITNIEFIETADGGLVCFTSDFTKEAIARYGIIGTKWRISVNDGSGPKVLDEYNWGLGAKDNGDPLRENTSNGVKLSAYQTNTSFLTYSYVVRNQNRGSTYECSIAIRTASGDGRFNSKSVTASFSTLNFNRIIPTPSPTPSIIPTPSSKSKTITCVKGKNSLKVKGKNPICPTGYKKK